MKFLLYLERPLLHRLSSINQGPRDSGTQESHSKTSDVSQRAPKPALGIWLTWLWEHQHGGQHDLTLWATKENRTHETASSDNPLVQLPVVVVFEIPYEADPSDQSTWPAGILPSNELIILVLQNRSKQMRLTLIRGIRQQQWIEQTPDSDLLKAIRSEMQQAALSARQQRQKARQKELSARETKMLNTFVHLVEQHYQDSQCAVPHLANIMGITGVKLQQICQRHFSVGPKAYLIQYRIQKSCEMIRQIPENRRCVMSKIALSSGFASSSYFSFIFLNQMGMTPTEYRFKHLHSNGSNHSSNH